MGFPSSEFLKFSNLKFFLVNSLHHACVHSEGNLVLPIHAFRAMSEHVVTVTPHRVESPVFRRGGKYQLVYIRGKTKVRPPGSIQCKEGCFLHTEQLGTFGNVAIHFKHKSSSQKYPYHTKLLTFEILDCNVPGSSGAMIGECQVDISQLIDTVTDSCHVKASFDFKMCGFGASLLLTVQVVPRGCPVPPLLTTRSASQGQTAQRPGGVPTTATLPTGRSVGADAVVKGGVVDVPRDTSMAVLVALEDTDFGTTGTPESASAAISLASLIDARLRKLPRARLLQEHDVDEAAGKLAAKATEELGSNAEAAMRKTLEQQLERLRSLRLEEEDWASSCSQDYNAVRSGRTSNSIVASSLPLQLLSAKYDVAKSSTPAPSAPTHSPSSQVAIKTGNYVPPVRPQPTATHNPTAQKTEHAVPEPTRVDAPPVVPTPPVEPEKAPEPPAKDPEPPGTEGMHDMFNSHVKREEKKAPVEISAPHPKFSDEPPTPLRKPIEVAPVVKENMFAAAAEASPILGSRFDRANPFASAESTPAQEVKVSADFKMARGGSMFTAEATTPVVAPMVHKPLKNLFAAHEEEARHVPAPSYPTGGNNMFEGGGSSGNVSKNPSFGGFSAVSFGGGDGGGGGRGGGWAEFGRGESIHFGGDTAHAESTPSFHVDPNPPVSMFAPSNEAPRFGAPTKGHDPFANQDDS